MQIQGQRIIQQGLIRVANVPNTSLLVNIPQVSRATDSPGPWTVVLWLLGPWWVMKPLGLALGSPIFPSGCEGKLGVALESLQGLRDLT